MHRVSVGTRHHVENMGQSQHILKYVLHYSCLQKNVDIDVDYRFWKTMGGKNEDLLCLYMRNANQSHLCKFLPILCLIYIEHNDNHILLVVLIDYVPLIMPP